MKGTVKLKKCLLWIMVLLMLTTNFDFSIFAQESTDAQSKEATEQIYTRKGHVFDDTNKNGSWDEGEAGLSGVRVTAVPEKEEHEAVEAVTDEEGIFSLQNLSEDTYTLSFYADNEKLTSYNITKSVSKMEEKTVFPTAEDTWFLQWQKVSASSDNELQLALQKDDVEAINEEINKEKPQFIEDTKIPAIAGKYAAGARGKVTVWMEYHRYKGYNVTANYTIGNKKKSNKDYIWIYLNGSNQALYCLQPGVTLLSGDVLDSGKGSLTNLYDKNTAIYLQRIAYYGCDYQGWGKLSDDEKTLYFMAAQSLIWENRGVTNISWNMQNANKTKIIIKEYKNKIKSKVENHEKKASFAGTTEIVTRSGTEPNTVFSFKDQNKMLSSSEVIEKSDGIKSAAIDGNTLKVVLKNSDKYDGTTQTIKFQKSFPSAFGNQYFTSSLGRQTIFYYGNPTPRTFSFSIKIQAKGNLRITKVDDTGAPVAGVSFRYGTSPTQLTNITAKTNDKGVTDLNNINAGTTIYVQEHEVPNYLVKSTEVKSVKIKASQTELINFRNNRVTTYVNLKKINSETKKPIAGATFSYTDGKSTYQSVTNTNGEFTSNISFPVGTKITMTEVSPGPGYMIPEGAARTQTKTLSLNPEDNKFIFENTPKKVTLSILKYNSRTKKPVQGVSFKVGPNLNGNMNTIDGYDLLTTDNNGKITSRNYDARTKIYYQEVDGPENIVLNKEIKTVSFLDENIMINIYNEESPVTLRVHKKGADNIPLKGVRFNVEEYFVSQNLWKVKESLITNTDGIADTSLSYSREAIAKGYIRLVETNTVAGYKQLDAPVVISRTLADIEKERIDVTVKNDLIPTKLTVYKYDSESKKPLAGAEFKITDAYGNYIQTLITKDNGEAVTKELLADKNYYIEETKTPIGYKKTMNGKQPFAMTRANTYEYTFNIPNDPIYGYIEVNKMDKSNHPLKGIEFTLYKGSRIVDTLITDEDGYAKSDKLLADAPYTIKETYAPPQYVTLVSDTLTIDFLKPSEYNSSGTGYTADFHEATMTMNYQIKNEEKLGRVTITKVDAEDSDIKVSGATFKLYNYLTGELLGERVTNEQGIAVFTDIPIVNPVVNAQQGYYMLEETTPGKNHVLPSNTKKYFSLTHQTLDFSITVSNPPVKGGVEIKKVDAEDTTKVLKDAQFALYKADDLTAPIKTGTTDEQGILRFDKLRYGEYVIKETKASKYHFNDLVNGGNSVYYDKKINGYRISISENNIIIPLTITNPKLKVQIKVIKQDDAGHLLKGAKFNIVSGTGDILDTITTNTDGIAYSSVFHAEELGDDSYIVEAEKLVGYKEHKVTYPIVISGDNTTDIELISQTVINTPEVPAMKIHKVNEDGKPVKARFRAEAIIQYGNPVIEEFETTSSNPTIEMESYLKKVISNMTDVTALIRITEVSTDDPYIKEAQEMEFSIQYYGQQYGIEPINKESWNKNISFDENTLTLSIINEKIPISLNLVKQDSDSNKYLAGAEFKITPNGEGLQPITVKTTDTAEGVTVELPYASSYTVEEIKAPEGYFNSYEKKTYTLNDFESTQGNGVITAYNKKEIIKNYKMPKLKIRKIGSDGKPLDATFYVTDRPFGGPTLMETVITDKQNNGYGSVDLSSLFVMSSELKTGSIYISEQSVSDNYDLYSGQIIGNYSISFGKMYLDFSSINDTSVKVEQSVDGSEVTLTVTNKRKTFDFSMLKKGIGTDKPTAAVTLTAYKKNQTVATAEGSYDINSVSPVSINSFFDNLKDEAGYDIYMEETATSDGYRLLPKSKAFTYYPDHEIKDKFKEIDEHITIDQSGTSFQITLQNERSYGLRIVKKDTSENTANAVFQLTASNLLSDSVKKEIRTTKGEADITAFLQELKEKQPKGTWNITIREMETDGGLQIFENNVAELAFQPSMLGVDSTKFLNQIYNADQSLISLKKDTDNAYSAVLTVKNKEIPVSFRLLKKDGKNSNLYLAGAVFEIRPEGKAALTVTTTADPAGVLVQLPYAAKYTVREIEAPNGYVLDSMLYEYSIEDFTASKEGSVITAYNMEQTYTNHPYEGKFEIVKTDADDATVSRDKLDGAVFQIYEGIPPASGTVEEKYTAVDESNGYKLVDTVTIGTQKHGTGVSKKLPYGDYIIKEISAPKDYQISKELIAKKIQADQVTIQISFPNKRKEGSLRIYKYSGELGKDNEKPLAGAVFTIHDAATDKQIGERITTDAAGSSGIVQLPYGDYYVKEVQFPAGYISSKGAKHPFVLNAEQTLQAINIQNTEAAYSFQLYKRDAQTAAGLANATFGLYENGKSPYAAPADEPLLIFHTNTNGIATVMLDQAGDYDIYELQAPNGYELQKEKIEIHVDDQQQTAGITVENHKKKLHIEIRKLDEDDRHPLAGAYYEIRNALTNEVVKAVGPSDEKGIVTVDVPAGDIAYIVKETSAPAGYKLDDTGYLVPVHTENAEDGTVQYIAEPVTITNRLVNGNIRLLKVDEDHKETRLGDAVFGVYNSSDEKVDELKTNSNGEAMSKELPSGTYTLKELQAPYGYKLDELKTYEAVLSADVRQVVITATNKKETNEASLKKIDALNQSIVLPDAEFELFANQEDARNLENTIQTAATDASGIATFKNLSYGTYYARETKAPAGYTCSDYIMELTVNADSAAAVPLEYLNYPQPDRASFTVIKRDATTRNTLEGARFLVEGPNGYHKEYISDETGKFKSDDLPFGEYTITETLAPKGYKLSDPVQQSIKLDKDSIKAPVTLEFVNSRIETRIHIKKYDDGDIPKPLMNAVFDIYKLDEDGGRMEPAVDRLVTDASGEAVSINLPEGSYELLEVLAPEGYEFIPSSDPHLIIVDKDSKAETEIIVKNKPITGSLEVLKTDAESKKPLSGVQFTIYRSDNSVYDVLTTDENGKGVLLQVPYGIYRIKETKVPAGYDLNEAYQDVFVIGSEQAQRSVSLHITNKQIKGKLALFKADADARDIGVAQARYGIYTKLITKADGTTEVDPDSYLGKEYDLITLPDIIIPEETDTKNGEQITQQRQQQPAVSKELPLGTYYIQELESPQGYQLNTEIYAKTLTADENYVEIFAEDDPIRASVTVHKTDAQSKKSLQGAVFAIYTKEDYEKLLHEGDQVQEIEAVYITTDEQGTAHADNLKLQEEYVLTEYKAPAGYEIDKNIEEHFTPDAGTLSFFYDFTNTKKAEIIIHKINDESYPLEGVLFGLYSFGPDQKAETADDVYIDTFSTGYDGTGIARYDTAALKNGWYYVREAKEPDMGYELSEEIKTFEITDQKREFTFTFVNHAAKGDVEIWKTDEMGNALQGAQFALYKAGDSWFTEEDVENNDVFVQDFVMDEGAHAIIKNLEVDCYVIKETKTPAGYKKADDIFFDLNHGEVQQENGRKQYYYRQEIRNVPIVGHIEVQKKIRSTIDRNADISLKNAVFHILDEQGSIADILVTDESGKATSRELAQGTYIVKEITAPLGSVLNTTPQRVTIDGSQSDDIYSYICENSMITGRILIHKTNEQKEALSGAEFDIVNEQGAIVDHVISEENGEALSDELAYGWYTIRETKAPDGYSMDPNMQWKVWIQEAEQTITVDIVNTDADENGVRVIKYDRDRPSLRLPGAVFALYAREDMETVLARYTTGADGTFQLDSLKPGHYVLKEISAPMGYVLDEALHEFTLQADSNIALWLSNEKPKGRIKFEKKGDMLQQIQDDTTYPELKKLSWQMDDLQGAEISIYAKETTYLDGQVYHSGDLIQKLESSKTSIDLPVGTYSYKETVTPSSYIPDTQSYDIDVKAEGTGIAAPSLITLENTHGSVQLELYKKFADTEDEAFYQHVLFGVFAAEDITENSVLIPQDTLLSVFGVDSSGRSMWQDQMLPKGRYYVRELSTKEGYVLDPHKYSFAISYQNRDAEIHISSQHEPIVNEPLYGTIKLEKTGSQFTKTKVYESQGYLVHEPVYTIEKLQGAEVEIYTEQTIEIDGVTYQKGDVVDTLISAKKEESRRLPLGTYTAKETRTPPGYIADEHTYTLTLSEHEQYPNAAVWEPLSIYNQKAGVKLTVYKKFFNTSDKELFRDVSFGIYAAEDIKGNTNAALLQKDDLIQILQISEDGSGQIETMLPAGHYYLKELTTANGYLLDTKRHTFTIEPDAKGEIQIGDITQEHPVMNYPEGFLSPFVFRKVDEDGAPLANAVFRLYMCNQKHEHDELVNTDTLDCWKEVEGLSPVTSTSDGIVDLGTLPNGDYQLLEAEAPQGYVLPKGQWYIHVANGIEIQAKGAPLPPAFARVDAAAYEFQLVNRRVRELPILGGRGVYLYLGGGSVLLLAAWQLMKRRKGEKHEQKK